MRIGFKLFVNQKGSESRLVLSRDSAYRLANGERFYYYDAASTVDYPVTQWELSNLLTEW